MFLLKNVDADGLVLHEGRRVVELSREEAFVNKKVTDFTKKVLKSF